MSDNKLSEELQAYAEAVRDGYDAEQSTRFDSWADRAAALEAELEQCQAGRAKQTYKCAKLNINLRTLEAERDALREQVQILENLCKALSNSNRITQNERLRRAFDASNNPKSMGSWSLLDFFSAMRSAIQGEGSDE